MNVLTAWWRPGTGRRRFTPDEAAAEKASLIAQNQTLLRYINGLHHDLANLKADNDKLRKALATAVRANEANDSATTVKLDMSELRSTPPADTFVPPMPPAPQYVPVVTRPAERAGAHPTQIPAGAR